MSALSIIVVALIAAAAVALVLRPFFVDSDDGDDPAVVAEQAEAADAVARSLDAISEIDFDYRAGNLSEEDFVALDRRERARAIDMLRQRDRPTGHSDE